MPDDQNTDKQMPDDQKDDHKTGDQQDTATAKPGTADPEPDSKTTDSKTTEPKTTGPKAGDLKSGDVNTGPQTYERRGMTRLLLRWLIRLYYPRIEISNADRIPQTGPVLLCGNHGNSLIDPVIIGIVSRRPVRFMAKAPLFKHPIIGPPMAALGMIPAYRGSDDAKQVRKNLESLNVGAKVLAAGNAMGIFPEGKSTDQAHLEMVRSGAARMALQAIEEGAEGLKIVPMGLTYERKDEFQSSALVQVGQPMDVARILADHEGNVRKARRAVTQELGRRLREVVVHLDEPKWEPWLEDLEVLAQPPVQKGRKPVSPLQLRKRIADAMNYFLDTDRPRAESVAKKIKALRDDTRAAGLTVDSPVMRTHGFKVTLSLMWNFLCLVLLLIPAAIGTIHHLVPFVIVRTIASRLDQPGRKTVSSNRLVVGVPLYLLWYAVVFWWQYGYFATWFACLWLAAAPLMGVIAIHYWRRAGRTAGLSWHQLRVMIQRGKLKQLRQQEAELRDQLGQMAQEYAEHSPRPETDIHVSKRWRVARAATVIGPLLILAALGWVGKYWFFDQPLRGDGLNLKELPAARIEAYLGSDERTLVRVIEGLGELGQQAIGIQKEFEDGQRSFVNQGDNDAVRELMRRYITYRQALSRIIWKYQLYGDIDNPKLRIRAFLVDFTAAAVLYDSSIQFVHQFKDDREAVAKLNEPESLWSIPPGLYDTIRRNLASPTNMKMFKAARQYYHQDAVQEQFKKHGLTTGAKYDRFHKAIANSEAMIAQVDDSLSLKIVKVAASDLGDLVHQVQYDTQSAISTWIGDFKIREPRQGKPLIDKQQLRKLSSMLEPGDILLERRNWYLSNAFLPGYWPHGAVYVGTADELKARGLDRNDMVAKHWREFAGKDAEGHEHVIIEAVSEGVIFSSLEHSIGGADSVAVLRPKLTDQQKNEAIVRAFSFAGRPYDFEFDFDTTDMLVCTEVVFRAYGGNSDVIQFPVERILGRNTLPAINLVAKYNKEWGTPEAQFEFIAFIEGDEATGGSRFYTDDQAFRETINRPANTFMQSSTTDAVMSIGPLGWVLFWLNMACLVGGLASRLPKRASKEAAPPPEAAPEMAPESAPEAPTEGNQEVTGDATAKAAGKSKNEPEGESGNESGSEPAKRQGKESPEQTGKESGEDSSGESAYDSGAESSEKPSDESSHESD